MALATASAQERTLFSPKPDWEWQEISESCLITFLVGMPLRQARETILPMLSLRDSDKGESPSLSENPLVTPGGIIEKRNEFAR